MCDMLQSFALRIWLINGCVNLSMKNELMSHCKMAYYRCMPWLQRLRKSPSPPLSEPAQPPLPLKPQKAASPDEGQTKTTPADNRPSAPSQSALLAPAKGNFMWLSFPDSLSMHSCRTWFYTLSCTSLMCSCIPYLATCADTFKAASCADIVLAH